MAILITGGAGYIGSHTCVELIQAGYDIIIVDNLSNSNRESVKRIELISGKKILFYQINLLHQTDIEIVFLENRIEAVIHFAGVKAVGNSVKEPLQYYQNNVTGTIILCEVMKKFNVNKMVFSSSATVYGIPEFLPIRENCKTNPTNPYGRTKLMIEEMLRDLYISNNEWSITILRYFNPIGAHKSGRIGEDANGIPNNLMPFITKVAAGKLQTLQIYGDCYPTIDGTGVRDYIHVVDLAKGHLKALEKTLSTSSVETYNIGTGEGNSVFELITAFESATGVRIPYKITNPRPGDIAISYADPSKAKQELGWQAEMGIEEMCEDAWRWQSNNPDGYLSNAAELISGKKS
ncbi:UDP-glucose 4-epimerase GalE [Cytobacillus praedii]|uniref:UDP-glucose 4-epimerase n=1 Tax=Cytobacillus praedii TaxID=1742358 RepID=A0A4R1B684_9BACI|nr:UDP-glucose 4-epimerase GalE [Cytobacillus praedii]TCJ05763.1 UDP-glucose 4-epimerase GalE [Cytobacillus praedii]